MNESNCFLEVKGRRETPATEEESEQLFLCKLKLGGRLSCREIEVDAKEVSNEEEEEADNLVTSAISSLQNRDSLRNKWKTEKLQVVSYYLIKLV